ncbi:MAG: cytochrome c biogenesis protein ResB [Candidatus Omnitrophota bacterium]
MKNPSGGNVFWETIKSARLAFVLLWAIIAVSFTGALLPAEQQPLVYSSVWFFFLLGLFAVNLSACSVDRIFFNRKKIGSTVTHIAVLLILAGALVSVLSGIRGHMELSEGAGSDRFYEGDRERQLPFSVTLEDFSLRWYDAAQNGFPVRVRVEDAGFKSAFQVRLNTVYPLGKTGYSFSAVKYLPHFIFNEDHAPVSVSDQPQNPALLIHIVGREGGEDRWIFSSHPDQQMGGDPNIRFRFDLEPQIKEFRSTVKVSDPSRGATFTRDIKVNSPLEYRGYSFYQARYDSAGLSWTGLDVVYDPGVKIVFLGFILLNLGIIAIFYPKLKASFVDPPKERT